jgi:hypothetical protein
LFSSNAPAASKEDSKAKASATLAFLFFLAASTFFRSAWHDEVVMNLYGVASPSRHHLKSSKLSR